MKYNIGKLKEDLSMQDIVMDCIEHKKKGGLTSVLCTLHDDKNYFSAYVSKDNKGVYCYACNKYIPALEYVMGSMSCNLPQACEIIADSIGNKNDYIMSGNKSKAQIKPKVKLLSPEDREFIGLVGYNKGVYAPVTFEKREDLKGYYENEYQEDDKYEVGYIKIADNPLQTLADEEPEIYKELVREKAYETIQKFKNAKELMTVLPLSLVMDIDMGCLMQAINEHIRHAEALYIEYGGVLIKKPKIIPLK